MTLVKAEFSPGADGAALTLAVFSPEAAVHVCTTHES